jgi:hypothetical protein
MSRFANIGPAERRKRHRSGVVAILLGVVVVVISWRLGLPLAVRAASGLLFFMGFVGVFQARAQTCVALASRGVRDMDRGPEPIEDSGEVAALRAEGRRVLVRSLVAALLVTAVAVLVR